jgi:hypothetical protein
MVTMSRLGYATVVGVYNLGWAVYFNQMKTFEALLSVSAFFFFSLSKTTPSVCEFWCVVEHDCKSSTVCVYSCFFLMILDEILFFVFFRIVDLYFSLFVVLPRIVNFF